MLATRLRKSNVINELQSSSGFLIRFPSELARRIAELTDGVEVDIDAPIEGDVALLAVGRERLPSGFPKNDDSRHINELTLLSRLAARGLYRRQSPLGAGRN